MNLLLFGFKASGKTHFGKLLSKQMKRPFIDTDEIIEELYRIHTGKDKQVRQIYKTLGELKFRSLEKQSLVLLKKIDNAVIALGGGSVIDPENVHLLQTIGALIYLKTSPETLKKRIFSEELPPILDHEDPERTFYQMVHEREPIYRSIPARTIDTDLLDEAGVLAALRSILLLEDKPNGF